METAPFLPHSSRFHGNTNPETPEPEVKQRTHPKVRKSKMYVYVIWNKTIFFWQLRERALSQVPHVRPETPRSVTHNHDEDFSDDDSDDKSPIRNGEKFD